MGVVGQYLTQVALCVAAYFAPIGEVFYIMLLFVAVDLVTGIWASGKQQIPRTSRRARKSVKKLGGYMVVIILSFLIERLLPGSSFAAHRFVAAFVCTIELLSILENIVIITEHPVFIKIIRLIRGKASQEALIKEILNEKNDLLPPADPPRNNDGVRDDPDSTPDREPQNG